MAYEVPDLPYDYDALEPHIDEQTMRVHHDKHHQAYVDKANAALEGTEWADRDVDDVLGNLDQLPDDKRTPVRNNGGGHSNHAFFWQSGAMVDLGTLGGSSSLAAGINAAGQVIGNSFLPGDVTERAFLWKDGVMIDQVVLSSAKYKTTRPGAVKNDTIILWSTMPEE